MLQHVREEAVTSDFELSFASSLFAPALSFAVGAISRERWTLESCSCATSCNNFLGPDTDEGRCVSDPLLIT